MSNKFKMTKAIPADFKAAPQMLLILQTLAGIGINKEVTTEELTKAVVDSGKLVTRQPPERIVGYYTKPISELDFVEVEKVAAAPKPKADKAAKAGDAPQVAKPGKPTPAGAAQPASPAKPATPAA